MIICRTDVFRYSIPPVEPFQAGGGRLITEREGFLLRLETQSGAYGFGEIAPFPGLNAESLPEALQALQNAAAAALGKRLAEPRDVALCLAEMGARAALPPSVACGAEAALLHCLAFSSSSLAEFLDQNEQNAAAETIAVNGLIAGLAGQMEAQAAELVAEGYSCLKIKAGRLPAREEIGAIRRIRELAGASVALRLDANRSWSLPEATEFLRAVADCGVEYVEEPLANVAELGALYAETGAPLALDESLLAAEPETLEIPEGTVAVVLKPMALGGMGRALEFARAARRKGLRAVVSSAFETGLTLAQYASFAARLNAAPVACGLDTYRRLSADVLAQPFRAEGGKVAPREAYRQSYQVQTERLTPLFSYSL